MTMFHPAIDGAEKNARHLINFSLLFLLSSWAVALVAFVDVPENELSWVALVQLASLPINIALLVYGTIWVKGLMVTSRFIQPEGFGYRQGWSFWGWITPIAQWWIPKRLVDYTTAIFDEFVVNSPLRKTAQWWALWVSISVLDLIGALIGLFDRDTSNAIGILSVIALTYSFPIWRTVVENATESQSSAIKKLEGLA